MSTAMRMSVVVVPDAAAASKPSNTFRTTNNIFNTDLLRGLLIHSLRFAK